MRDTTSFDRLSGHAVTAIVLKTNSVSPAMLARRLQHIRLRTLIVGACGLVLAWLVVSKSLAAYFADSAPRVALFINPQEPGALVNLADLALNSPLTTRSGTAGLGVDRGADKMPGDAAAGSAAHVAEVFSAMGASHSVDLATLRGEIGTAIEREPLSAHALRLLGQVATTSGDDATALKAMSAAAHISLHEDTASYWLMRKSGEAGDYQTAVDYADALLRTTPALAPYVVPVLAHFAEDKRAFDAVKSALRADPPWRAAFFERLPQSVSDARTPLQVMLALRSDPAPPTIADITPYIQQLVGHGYYRLAYYTWLQFLPPDDLRRAALLFDGDFDKNPSGLPFDWTIQSGTGVTVDFVPRPGKPGRRALLVDFQFGRVDFKGVSELVMLPPGSYRFSGEFKSQLVGPRGMKWRVVCANTNSNPIGESAMINGMTKDWTGLAFDFTVPEKDCPAQYVRLNLDTRMASEQLVSGSVLFGDLKLIRSDKSAATGG